MLKFQNSEFSISGVKMLCQSISINEQSSLSPIYAMGYRGSNYQSPSGPNKTTISVSYFCEITGDIPNTLLNQVKSYDSNSFPARVVVAGKTGSAYLTRYSLSCPQHSPVVANAEFDVYHELSGQYVEQSSSIVNQYNSSNGSGIGHYWSTYPVSHNGLATGQLIDFNYSASLEWRPTYKIGTNIPVEVDFLKGNEEFSLNHENTGVQITYSGRLIEENFPNFHKIELYPLSYSFGNSTANKITLFLASGEITSNRVDLREDSTTINSTSVVKYI